MHIYINQELKRQHEESVRIWALCEIQRRAMRVQRKQIAFQRAKECSPKLLDNPLGLALADANAR